MPTQKRSREVQLIVRVAPDEKELVEHKMKQLGTKNFNAYARKMLIDGLVVNVDLSKYHELANEVNKVGVNINQIAKVVNETRYVSSSQMERLEELINEIWQLLKLSLSELQSTSR